LKGPGRSFTIRGIADAKGVAATGAEIARTQIVVAARFTMHLSFASALFRRTLSFKYYDTAKPD
jgi:hypothetical protein